MGLQKFSGLFSYMERVFLAKIYSPNIYQKNKSNINSLLYISLCEILHSHYDMQIILFFVVSIFHPTTLYLFNIFSWNWPFCITSYFLITFWESLSPLGFLILLTSPPRDSLSLFLASNLKWNSLRVFNFHILSSLECFNLPLFLCHNFLNVILYHNILFVASCNQHIYFFTKFIEKYKSQYR